ncbi:MAG: sensor histidine kinase [Polaribacter sp.]
MVRKVILYVFLISFKFAFSNSKEIISILNLIKYEKYKEVNIKLDTFKGDFIYDVLNQFINYKKLNFNEKPLILNNKSEVNKIAKAIQYINKGLYNFYSEGNEVEAFKNFNESLKISKDNNLIDLICENYRNILSIYEYHSDITSEKTYTYSLNDYKKYTYNDFEKTHYKYFKYRIPQRFNSVENYKFNILEVNQLQKKIENLKYKYLTGKFYITKATLFFHYIKNRDSAFFYLEKAKLKLNNKHPIYIERHTAASLNLINYYIRQKDFLKAEQLVSNIKIKEENYLSSLLLKFYFLRKWKIYEGLKTNKGLKIDSALFYNIKYLDQELKINHQRSISEISKHKSLEKEKENIILKNKRKQDQIFLFSLVILLSLGTLIAVLILKNSKRKRKLAEQQKALETQKNLTLLKEQEITTINAMVDGQEKERKRIAEDLHDNLGSVLATLKLHFENLKINREKKKINQEELFGKTENLIDEAYLKVRSIAHAKNAGVIANQGLLMAVQMMAEKISSADKIQIEVIDFGLDKRLENSLEISVFRIIQELLTNIIKHADAKNATINISLYEKNLNIIIEDDGKGFDIKKVNMSDGMGIGSIKTRIKHLEGTFEVDSTVGKGSSVIMDIPIS